MHQTKPHLVPTHYGCNKYVGDTNKKQFLANNTAWIKIHKFLTIIWEGLNFELDVTVLGTILSCSG
jgi:hypothetical protein